MERLKSKNLGNLVKNDLGIESDIINNRGNSDLKYSSNGFNFGRKLVGKSQKPRPQSSYPVGGKGMSREISARTVGGKSDQLNRTKNRPNTAFLKEK